MYTLSQLRREVNALQVKYAKYLAVTRLRVMSEQIADEWTRAVADQKPAPPTQPYIRRVSEAGFHLTTHLALHRYLERMREEGQIPEPRKMVLALLPWAWDGPVSRLLDCELDSGCYETELARKYDPKHQINLPR